MTPIDPITTQVIRNALKAAAEDYLKAAFRMERYGPGDE